MKKIILLLIMMSSLSFAKYGLWQPAYEFNIPELMGKKKVSMKIYKTRVILLNLWASWCDGCKKEMPLLDKLGHQFNQDDFRVVAVNVDSKKSKGRSYVKKLKKKLGHEPRIMFLYDEKKETAKAYKTSAFPLSLLIKNGKIINRYLGSFNEDNEEALLKDIQRALR